MYDTGRVVSGYYCTYRLMWPLYVTRDSTSKQDYPNRASSNTQYPQLAHTQFAVQPTTL